MNYVLFTVFISSSLLAWLLLTINSMLHLLQLLIPQVTFTLGLLPQKKMYWKRQSDRSLYSFLRLNKSYKDHPCNYWQKWWENKWRQQDVHRTHPLLSSELELITSIIHTSSRFKIQCKKYTRRHENCHPTLHVLQLLLLYTLSLFPIYAGKLLWKAILHSFNIRNKAFNFFFFQNRFYTNSVEQTEWCIK